MNKLEKLIPELESRIPKKDLLNPEISAASVGWHLEHSIISINAIIDDLKQSDPAAYKWELNLTRKLVFTAGKIPRGRAKVPEAGIPKSDFETETIRRNLELAKANIKDLETMDENCYFVHPVFGQLNRADAITFLVIHTRHHLEIVDDIIGG